MGGSKPLGYKPLGLLYIILLGCFLLFIFVSTKTYKNYKKTTTIIKNGRTEIIKDWIKGNSFHFTDDNNISKSLSTNDYTISFLVYLNNHNFTDKFKPQYIFTKGPNISEDMITSLIPLLPHTP